MDPLTHLTQKLLAERARQPRTPLATDQIPPTAPPPPYTTAASDASDTDSEAASDDADNPPPSVTLTLHAGTSIHGAGNLVPPAPAAPLADATKFSALLLHAVDRINAARRPDGGRVNVALTIHCGVQIVGDRNVVGCVGVKARTPERGMGEGVVVAGAKRKADEVGNFFSLLFFERIL